MQTITQPPGRARARLGGRIQFQVANDHFRESAKAFLRVFKVLRPESFLRTVNPAGARRSQERVLNIERDDHLGEWLLPRGGTNPPERAQLRPLINRLVLFVQESPAQRAREAEAAVIR